jgi:hypothetical protein
MEWLFNLQVLGSGLLSLLIAWQFFNMSRKILSVMYLTLFWSVAVIGVNVLLNPSYRAEVAAIGLWPLLVPIVLSVVVLWYVYHLDETGRLGA